MKRNVLQIPIKSELRKKAEMKAESLGFSSLQEMVRVMLTKISGDKDVTGGVVDDICDKYGISYLGMFGSMARGEAKRDSDIDLMVKFRKGSRVGLFELARIQEEFENKLGRKVDLVTKMNKNILPEALRDMRTIYEK